MWVYLAALASAPDMAGAMAGPMAGMSPRLSAWTTNDAWATLLMWSVMMVGMMTPSVAPMILIYARVARHAAERGTPFAPVGWFALGYFSPGLLRYSATARQWALEMLGFVAMAAPDADARA